MVAQSLVAFQLHFQQNQFVNQGLPQINSILGIGWPIHIHPQAPNLDTVVILMT